MIVGGYKLNFGQTEKVKLWFENTQQITNASTQSASQGQKGKVLLIISSQGVIGVQSTGPDVANPAWLFSS